GDSWPVVGRNIVGACARPFRGPGENGTACRLRWLTTLIPSSLLDGHRFKNMRSNNMRSSNMRLKRQIEKVADARRQARQAISFDAPFRAQLRDLLLWRRDVRRFRRDALPDGMLESLLEFACLAPSVGLSEPW